MDPITAAIIAGVAAGATSGATDVVKQTLVDAYNELKRLLLARFGDNSKLARTIQDVEEDPKSEGAQITLKEQVAKTGAAQDSALLQAAQQLQAVVDRMQGQAGSGVRTSIAGSVTDSIVQTTGRDAINTGGGGFTGRDRTVHGDEVHGDKTTVGNITGSQGVAIGRNASTIVTGSSIGGEANIDAQQLRATLEELWEALGQMQLPVSQTLIAQTAAGNALSGVKENQVEANTVVENVKKIGETLKQANVTVQEGSTLWESVMKLVPLLGPLVGGARIVAGWFGIPL